MQRLQTWIALFSLSSSKQRGAPSHMMWGFVGALVMALLMVGHLSAEQPRTVGEAQILARTAGVGSIPGMLLRDGTVCISESRESSSCRPLAKLPQKVIKNITANGNSFFFDGIYDLDRSGSPQIFLDYWPASDDARCLARYREGPDPDCGAIALLVYKKWNESYREYAFSAETEGYSPGAWFIDDSRRRKAVFKSRCNGSSGDCLLYLNWKKQALVPIAEDVLTTNGPPVIVDVDRDGNSEIFAAERGYDRTAQQGAILLRWNGDGFSTWWPQWKAPPYVMYAFLADLDNDHTDGIVAVLDTNGTGLDTDSPEATESRELGIWRLVGDKWKVASKIRIPATSALGRPEMSFSQRSGRTDIALSYADSAPLTCRYERHRLSCSARAPLSSEHSPQ